MAHFKIYMNNPTAGSTDGTAISSGDNSLPLSATLDATQSETAIFKCAVRCESGYEVSSDMTITTSGTSCDKWKLALDDDYANATIASVMCDWSSEITLESVTAVNKVFWVKRVTGDSTETPSNDSSVKIKAEGTTSEV